MTLPTEITKDGIDCRGAENEKVTREEQRQPGTESQKHWGFRGFKYKIHDRKPDNPVKPARSNPDATDHDGILHTESPRTRLR